MAKQMVWVSLSSTLVFPSEYCEHHGAHTTHRERPKTGASINLNLNISKALFLSHFYVKSKQVKVLNNVPVPCGLCCSSPEVYASSLWRLLPGKPAKPSSTHLTYLRVVRRHAEPIIHWF